MPEVERTVVEAIEAMLARREMGPTSVTLASDIYEELGLDSLEVAELSALLEDSFGTDPYSAGIIPRTVGEVVAFYV